jgi:hypothetical protein
MNKQFIEFVLLTIKTDTQRSFAAQNKVGSAVRIENEKDESFWRPVLETALPNFKFIFFPYFKDISLTKGKTDIKKYIDFADKDLIF